MLTTNLLNMKTSLVLNKNQIITNIKTIEKYLMGDLS